MPYSSFQESVQLLRTRRFGTFWFASLLSNIGTWAQQVAQPWLLLSLGASSFLVGLDAFAMSAPVWFLTLLGGVLADRADRRRVIAGFQSLQMLCPTAIVILLAAGRIEPWMIICLSVVVGVTDALSMPSFSSIVPTIVAREQIAAGLALNSTQFNVSRIAGPALAGAIMASIGAIGCFAISAASYVPFIGVALWILPHQVPAGTTHESPARHPATGLRGIARRPDLRGVLLTTFCSGMLCGPMITFAPVLVRSTFHGTAGQFSLVLAAFGAGGLLGAVGLLAIDARRDRRHISTVSAIAYGTTVMAAALSPWFWALPALLVLAGLTMSVTNISANAYLQTTASALVRGRAVSLYMLAMRGGLALGAIGTGWSVSALGIREALLLNGGLAVIVQCVIARSSAHR
jgi:MFS family permease